LTGETASVRRDRFLGGQLVLTQPETGYRAGLDAALLAAALDLEPGARAAEFGCGAGAALLAAAVLNPGAHFTGIERDEQAAALARRNVADNALGGRVAIACGDALDWRPEEPLDAVFFNPPFFDDPASLRAPGPGKQAAWINTATLESWIAAGLKRLRPGGALTLIHRADRLGEALAAMQGRAGDIAVLAIHPRAHLSAKRILVRARSQARAPLRILPALVLHEAAGGGYTPQADAVLRGQARLTL